MLLLVTILSIDGKTVPSPISYNINKAKVSPISNDIEKHISIEKTSSKLIKRHSEQTESGENPMDFLSGFRKLRQNRSDSEIRVVGTVGLISGALKVEEAMRKNLYNLADELFSTFNKSTAKQNMEKLLVIEETIDRDKSSIAFLTSALKYARNSISFDDFQKEMRRILKEVR